MSVPEYAEDDVLTQIDWDNLFDFLPECDSIFSSDPEPLKNSSNSDDSVSSWVGEIEAMLMKDDEVRDDSTENQELVTEFLADILVESPAVHTPGNSSGEVLDVSTDKDSSDEGNSSSSGREKENDVSENEKERGAGDASLEVNNNAGRGPEDGATEVNDNDGEDPEDPVSKKRRRQLRNRDAAVRSRERKKMYVKDLEIKSRYLEGECRRLDRLLQCFIAENQALRLSLQNGNAFGVTSTKQESAVLLLESLLLGSLLWFLGIMCLFVLPAMPQSALVAVPLENVVEKAPENTIPRGARSKIFVSIRGQSFGNSRRCKASRTKMKWMSLSSLRVLV